MDTHERLPHWQGSLFSYPLSWRKDMRLKAHWMRACVLLSATWMVCVLCIVLYEYARYSPWCEFPGPMARTSSCLPWFWAWYAKSELPRFIVAIDLSSASRLFLPRLGWLIGALLAGPCAFWCAALAAVWTSDKFRRPMAAAT